MAEEVQKKKPKPSPKQEAARFKKGQSGNPKGAVKLPPAVKAVRYLGNDQVAEMGTILLEGTLEDMQYIVADKNASALKRWTASLIIGSIKNQDVRVWKEVLNRIVGKIPERIEIGEVRKSPIEEKVAAMTKEERKQFLLDASKDFQDILDAD